MAVEDIVGEASPERREGERATGGRHASPPLPRAFLEKLCWPRELLENPAATAWLDAPGTPRPGFSHPWTLDAAQAYCRRLARSHYENFTVAGWLTPAALRQPIADIYAFCRWADDLADELPGSPADRLAALDGWHEQLMECWRPELSGDSRAAESGGDGRVARRARDAGPPHPVFVALRATRERFGLELQPFEALLAAFRQDQTASRYETWDELLAYCGNSAAPVGRLLLRLAGVDEQACAADGPGERQTGERQTGEQQTGERQTGERQTSERRAGDYSDAICAGLQIANFCQDVRRDWERGRVYLPRQAWRRHGCDESDFAAGNAWKLAPIVRDGVELAARLFESGRPLLSMGPAWLRSDVALFLGGGEAILHAIRRQQYAVWSVRPVVSRWAKWRLIPAALRAFRAARRAAEFADNRE